jgi:hypothetical protein
MGSSERERSANFIHSQLNLVLTSGYAMTVIPQPLELVGATTANSMWLVK